MRSSLDDLNNALKGKLSFFRVRGGAPDTTLLDDLFKTHAIRGVFFNSDVTPFAIERDTSIKEWCAANNVFIDSGEAGEGYTFWPAGTIKTKSTNTVPKVFSAFFRYTSKKHALIDPIPVTRSIIRMIQANPDFEADNLPEPIHVADMPPAKKIMKQLESGHFDNYGDTRNDYTVPTTRLSAHLKFGRVDPLQVLRISRKRKLHELCRQLLWREFYYHLAYGYPELLRAPNEHIRPDRQKIQWRPVDNEKAKNWLEGKTGEPLVDQAMVELSRSGYIHNRLRMVVASYFTKDMGLDWREGERLLATRLVDYDPAQNSGGWQSVDAQRHGQEIKASTQLKKYGPVIPSK